jgi:hypothetical protein
MLPRWGPDALASAAAAAAHGSASLPDSTVKKIAYAMKHGLEMVVSEWLLDCAAEGRRVQEGLHRPDGDVNLLEFPVGAGATQGAGLTQLPVTQLQQTQAQVGGQDGIGGLEFRGGNEGVGPGCWAHTAACHAAAADTGTGGWTRRHWGGGLEFRWWWG